MREPIEPARTTRPRSRWFRTTLLILWLAVLGYHLVLASGDDGFRPIAGGLWVERSDQSHVDIGFSYPKPEFFSYPPGLRDETWATRADLRPPAQISISILHSCAVLVGLTAWTGFVYLKHWGALLTLWLARRGPKPGQCASCRYDRAGLAPEATCPECGATPVSAKR